MANFTFGSWAMPGTYSVRLTVDGKTVNAKIRIAPRKRGDGYELLVNGTRHDLKEREYTPWVKLSFHAARGVTLRGIARFYPMSMTNGMRVYVTPIHIDPEAPAIPVSHPSVFSIYLSKLMGPFGTLGLAEDTSALNDGAIDEKGFLDQAYGTLLGDQTRRRSITGTGVAVNFKAPWNTMFKIDVGKSFLPAVVAKSGSVVLQFLVLKPL